MNYIFGVYSHISKGSSNEAFSKLLNEQLKPLLTLAFKNPAFKFLLHLNASVIQWLDTFYPEINMLIGSLCRNGQLELLSSSFYESILQLVPPYERTAQLEKTNTYLRKKFSAKRPYGLWCTHQIFSPSLLSLTELSSLDYIIISTHNQMTDYVLYNKPFKMEEFGRQTIVFPSDDYISKEISQLPKTLCDSSSLNEKLIFHISSMNQQVNTIMINLDQMLFCENSCEIYSHIINLISRKTVFPSEIIEQHNIKNRFYLPEGIYGYDFEIGKFLSLNNYISSNGVLNYSYSFYNFIRETAKGLKKNKDTKKIFDHLFMKAAPGNFFIPDNYKDTEIRKNYSKALCELEYFLYSENILPPYADIDSDNTYEILIKNKSYIFIINPIGAFITHLNIFSVCFDFSMNSKKGIFHDFLKTDKLNDLGVRKWDLKSADKKKQDYIAISPKISVDKNQIQIVKHFKPRLNSLSADYQICCTGSSEVTKFTFETDINITFPAPMSDKIQTQITSDTIKTIDYEFLSFSLSLSEKFNVQIKNITLGEDLQYQYTQIKLTKEFLLKNDEIVNFSVMIKTEKKKNKGVENI